MIRSCLIAVILVLTVFCGSTLLAAVECDQATAPEEVRIYFANGMNNTLARAKQSYKELKILLGGSDKDFGLSYNEYEQWHLQNYEVYKQRKNSSEEFWYWLRNPHMAPQWFLDEYVAITGRLTYQAVFDDSDLHKHIRHYLADLHSGKKVVIVSHSQGNFYANNAYRFIRQWYPHFANSIGIVSVATPATWVEGQGFSNINEVYTTNPADVVIQTVERTYPDTLNPNVSAYNTPNFSNNHSFVRTYLPGYSSRIRGQILNRIASLEPPEKNFKCKEPEEVSVKVKYTSAGNISSTAAKLHGYVTSGKRVAVYATWRPVDLGAPATCWSVRNSIATSGNLNTGGTFFVNAKGLLPDTNYRYRVCGRQGDRISDSGLKPFKTSMTCGSTLEADGGSEGLSMNYFMGDATGDVRVYFNAWTFTDKLEIWQGGDLRYSTGYTSGKRIKYLRHYPSRGQTWEVRIYGGPKASTKWELSISCPQ